MNHCHKVINCPIGKLTLVANERSLKGILWDKDPFRRTQIDIGQFSERNSLLIKTENQLLEYFNHERKSFDLTIELNGTDFQKKVWKSLRALPYGKTRSYSDLASEIGFPRAWRAVGTAIGRNPISIVVPCHRVIAVNGTLGGFAGGLKAKAYLIDLESMNPATRTTISQGN